MTEQLREALRDINDLPTPPPPASASLWRRGRRRRRIREAAVAATVLGVVAAGGSWWTSSGILDTELGPVDGASEPLRAPDVLHQPDGWTRSVSQTGAPGPLAVVARTGTRDFWLRSEERWLGVSGVDQGYHWLDLPDMAEDESTWLALSPDGRYVGYHLGGEPTGAVVQSDIVGFGVYDTISGDVTERRIPTEHGLSVDFDSLTWSADSSRLIASYGQYRKQVGSSTFEVTEAWEPATGAVQPLSAPDQGAGMEWYGSLHAWGDGLWTWVSRRMVEVDSVNGSVQEVEGPRASSASGVPGPPVPNAEGSRLAYRGETKMRGGWFPALYTAPVAPGGRVGEHRLLDSRWYIWDVEGWADERTVLVRAHTAPFEDPARHRVLAWDVVDNSTQQVMRLDESLLDLQLAADATTHPFVEDRSWQVPTPPPLVVLVGLGVLVGVVLVRRTRHSSAAVPGRPEGDE